MPSNGFRRCEGVKSSSTSPSLSLFSPLHINFLKFFSLFALRCRITYSTLYSHHFFICSVLFRMSSDSERSAEAEANAKACRYDWIYFRLSNIAIHTQCSVCDLLESLFRARVPYVVPPSNRDGKKKTLR